MPEINENSSLKSKYPSGSTLSNNKIKSKDVEEPRVGKSVPPPKVTIKKAPWFKRVFSAVTSADEPSSIGAFVLQDVIIPAVKKVTVDVVESWIEMLMYGETKRNKQSLLTGSKSIFNYNGISTGTTQRQEISRMARKRHDFNGITFATREDAKDILNRMLMILEQYPAVRVADFYEMLDVTASPQDYHWGWTNLKMTEIRPTREGWILVLPQTEPI